jgi:hypothetical protein
MKKKHLVEEEKREKKQNKREKKELIDTIQCVKRTEKEVIREEQRDDEDIT